MALQDTIAQLLDEADTVDVKGGNLLNQIVQASEARALLKLRDEAALLTASAPPAQWQAIREKFRSRRTNTPDRRDDVLRLIGAAVRDDNQAAFWRGVVVLALMVRDSMPHIDEEFSA